MSQASPKVLLVEDELLVATSIAQKLEKSGYGVTGMAASAEEALAALARSLPDLVLMDIRIKGPVDGVQTAQEIRDRFRLPIIFLTSVADGETVGRAKATEPFGYLVKPVSHSTLISAIEVALYKHSMDCKLEERERVLRRANEELEQFAYAAAHDLQEPLRNVGLATQLLAQRYTNRFDSEADLLLKAATNGASRMLAMIKGLLDYSRALRPEQEEVELADCNKTLSLTLKNLEVAIAEKQAKISYDRLPCVRVSEMHLVQIFQNLVGNAIKYSGPKQPCIHISTEQRSGACVFFVKDNGLGIPPEQYDRAFGIFKRLHGGDIPGSGIGLALCKRIVEHYGGRIWIESGNEGTTLLFTLPVDHACVKASA